MIYWLVVFFWIWQSISRCLCIVPSNDSDHSDIFVLVIQLPVHVHSTAGVTGTHIVCKVCLRVCTFVMFLGVVSASVGVDPPITLM